MATYEYQCDICHNFLSEEQSIKEYKTRVKCPKCKRRKLRRVYGTPYVAVKEVKTVGQLAERNTKKMGKVRLQEKHALEGERMEQAEKQLPPGMSRVNRKNAKRPWWRDSDKVDTSLTKLSKKKKEKYIITGEK